MDLDWLSGFATYLADDYDWETDRNRFGNRHVMIPFEVAVRCGGLHVTLPEGAPEGRMPILLLHGWPSSGLEYAQVAAQLEQAGLYPVIADLPGFGFSAPTAAPIGPRQIAVIMRRALKQGLGVDTFAVHGNDWGATVAGWLAADHADAISGIHISMMGLRPTFGPDATKPDETEISWIKTVQKRLAADAGYREIQGTHPNTAAVGLSDSPIGLAAWIAEKLHGWNGGGAEPSVPRDDIAALVTAYWISGAIPSANWIYRAVREHDETAAPAGAQAMFPSPAHFSRTVFFRRRRYRGASGCITSWIIPSTRKAGIILRSLTPQIWRRTFSTLRQVCQRRSKIRPRGGVKVGHSVCAHETAGRA